MENVRESIREIKQCKNQKCYEKTTPEMKKYAKRMVSDFKQYHKRMIQREKNRIPNSVRNNKMFQFYARRGGNIYNLLKRLK